MVSLSKELIPVGYKALVDHYQLNVLPHYRWSYVSLHGGRRVYEDNGVQIYVYDKSYLPKDGTVLTLLVFALKHEGLNLSIIAALFEKLVPSEIVLFVQQAPTSKYARIIWYLYESLTQKKLVLDDCTQGPYVLLLDPVSYYTAVPINSTRHRIKNNLLGNANFCPIVRKTETLKSFEQKDLPGEINNIISKFDTYILERASNYLFTKETLSSYQIERENPDKKRIARFIELLKIASLQHLTKQSLIELQNVIVDERFANKDYRTTQNYIGENLDWQHQYVHYISPKPEDVEFLMQGLLASFDRLLSSQQPPIVIAATISFGFVFIHPFDDGNGRIHRFLIHYFLSVLGFTPKNTIFPVSATMLQNMKAYNDALECFSKLLLTCIPDYDLSDQGELTVPVSTRRLYQFIDYTAITEYLYACIEQTLYGTFQQELNFLVGYDTTKKQIQEVVDLPDNQIDLFIRLIVQSDGKLSEKKRVDFFSKLTDAEIQRIVTIVSENMIKKS